MPVNPVLRIWLAKLEQEASKQQISLYLVGGFIRDGLLGFESSDLDFCGGPGTLQWIREYASGENLRFQDIRRHSRVRLRLNGYIMDFTEWGTGGLAENLNGRDFSVNAMALPLREYVCLQPESWEIVDPLFGLSALQEKRLSTLPGAFATDPVRILRGIRLALRLSLEPDQETLVQSRANVQFLRDAPPERLGAEILSILKADPAGLPDELHRWGVDKVLFNTSTAYRGPFFPQRLEKILRCGFFPQHIYKAICGHLREPVTVPHRRLELLRLTSLCLTMGLANAKSISHFLCTGREKLAIQQNMGAYHWLLQQPATVNDAAITEYFRLFGISAIEGLLLWCTFAGPGATEKALRFLDSFARKSRLVAPPRYIKGGEIACVVSQKGLAAEAIGETAVVLQRASSLRHIGSEKTAWMYLRGFTDGKVLINCRIK
jgi:hypothetical protein